MKHGWTPSSPNLTSVDFFVVGSWSMVIRRNSIRSSALLLACGTMDMRKQQLGSKIDTTVHIHCSMSFGIADS